MNKKELTQFIKSEALRLGFDICGTAKAEAVPDDVIRLYNQWIAQEYHAPSNIRSVS